jgi:hypothetical protein
MSRSRTQPRFQRGWAGARLKALVGRTASAVKAKAARRRNRPKANAA